jgi:hypothetical protein
MIWILQSAAENLITISLNFLPDFFVFNPVIVTSTEAFAFLVIYANFFEETSEHRTNLGIAGALAPKTADTCFA